jgi:hypothetical protein
MSNSAKMAVSVPARTFAALESVRKKAGLGRSAAVARAIDAWVSEQRDPRGPDARYVEGYLRHPEDMATAAAIAEAGLASFGDLESRVALLSAERLTALDDALRFSLELGAD